MVYNIGMKHKLSDVCAKAVKFKVVGGKLKDVEFYSGCPGNLKAMAMLLEGMPVRSAVAKLKGITCGEKATSCSDQLAKVLEKISKDSK